MVLNTQNARLRMIFVAVRETCPSHFSTVSTISAAVVSIRYRGQSEESEACPGFFFLASVVHGSKEEDLLLLVVLVDSGKGAIRQ
jgi:hypothetical protein